jgi:predicted lysophospholipase L1 biosynthesis ABC-type transport system permease subunit
MLCPLIKRSAIKVTSENNPKRSGVVLVIARALHCLCVSMPIGIVIGLAGSFALTRVLRTYLYGISPTDIITFAATTMLLVVAGLAACLLPARKATKVDPLDILRSE